MATLNTQCNLEQLDTFLSPSVRIIQNHEEMDSLAGAWEALAAKSDCPTQQFHWARASAASFAAPDKLRVVVVGEPQPVAILPLIERSAIPGRLEWLGGRELYEPTDALYADPSDASLLADALVHLGAPLFLNRVPADSPLIAAMESACRKRGILVNRSGKACPLIPLDDTWVEPEQHFNAGRRSDLRRARRTAEQKGPVRFEVLSPTLEELEPLFNEALRVEASSWKGLNGSDLSSDGSRGSFYRQYAAAASQRGILRLCFMQIGDQVAAMQIAVECGRGFWLLKIGHRGDYDRCSPGTLLMLETVRYAAMRGLASYEFLGKVEPWTQVWTRTVRPCVSLLFYPATAQGGLALAGDAAGIAYRRIDSLVRGQK